MGSYVQGRYNVQGTNRETIEGEIQEITIGNDSEEEERATDSEEKEKEGEEEQRMTLQ